MEPFISHRGKIATLNRANVDTDQIIPKQFLKSIRRTGYGENLFFDWRYLADGSSNPEFEVNQPCFKNASVLVTRNNFGCGSSREHAVWAIVQYGFKVVIAPRQGDIPAFADIFSNNSVKNGLLNIELSAEEVETIFKHTQANEGLETTVDLENQKITLHTPTPLVFSFKVDPAVKAHLMGGLDEIGLSLKHAGQIDQFEKTHRTQLAS